MAKQIDYTEVFNNVLKQKVNQLTAREQLIEEVEGHLTELEGILNSAISAERFKHTSVEYRASEKLLCMECHSECMEIKFDAEQMLIDIVDKVVSFKDDEAVVEYKNEADVFINRDAEGNIMFDLGADNRSVSEFYTYVVERAAGLVSKSK